MMEEKEIIEKINEFFEDNYETMRLEGGHSITEYIKEVARNQAILYYKKMKDVASTVTHTEVKLTLPEQKTPKGRNFAIEGVVDIVRDDDETCMYDIKTHEADYIISNKSLYEQQLNVYAHIWQELRKEELDSTSIISTAIPAPLTHALSGNDGNRINYEMEKWKPLIPIPFMQENVKDTVYDFACIVDEIEDKKFQPVSVDVLNTKMEGTNALFATRVCRNCDARFSCASYREYAIGKGKGERGNFKKYFEDFGSDTDKEEWVNANLQAKNTDEINLEA